MLNGEATVMNWQLPRFRSTMFLALLLAVSSGLPAVEKFAVLQISDLVFTGKASEFHWALSFYDWRLMWTLHATVDVSEILKGPREMQGKRVDYVFRCAECSVFAWPPTLPQFTARKALWFVSRSGTSWEAAWGASGDPCIVPLCNADYFRRFLRGDPRPYPRACRPEDGR